jgi:hypothetical protein
MRLLPVVVLALLMTGCISRTPLERTYTDQQSSYLHKIMMQCALNFPDDLSYQACLIRNLATI